MKHITAEHMPAHPLISTLQEYTRLGIPDQIDYKKFYLYSIITHSTAIEGSTVTEVENQLLFDEGITATGRTLQEQMMNLDLKAAYEEGIRLATQHTPYSVELLCRLSSIVMKNTGSTYNTPLGSFSAAKGELRLLNVTAGFGGRSYLAYTKVPQALHDFCSWLNRTKTAIPQDDILAWYRFSFEAHYRLVTIHPWADGNGRMSRLVMNMLQFEQNLIPVKILKEQKAAYIEALNQTRDQGNLQVFLDTMLQLHTHNLQTEIAEYQYSMQTDSLLPTMDDTQNVTQNVTQTDNPLHLTASGTSSNTQDLTPDNTANDISDDTASRLLTPRQRQILQMVQTDTTISAATMATRLGITVRTVRRDMEALRRHYSLHWEGSSKQGHWQFLPPDKP